MAVLESSSTSTQSCADPALIISSDGHAMAKMVDYRPYLPFRLHEQFDDFLKLHKSSGSEEGVSGVKNQAIQTDHEILDAWSKDVVEAGRLDGTSDPARRLYRMEIEGIAAEVLFPDFGLPFEMVPQNAAAIGYAPTLEQAEEGKKAHSRWLLDFCSLHRSALPRRRSSDSKTSTQQSRRFVGRRKQG